MNIDHMKQDLTAFIKGFKYAFDGIIVGIKARHMRGHRFVAIAVVALGLLVSLTRNEWMMVVISIGMVFSAELFNTAIENLADILRDEDNLSYQATKNARDLAAGAVLMVSIATAIVGAVIFLPKMVGILL